MATCETSDAPGVARSAARAQPQPPRALALALLPIGRARRSESVQIGGKKLRGVCTVLRAGIPPTSSLAKVVY